MDKEEAREQIERLQKHFEDEGITVIESLALVSGYLTAVWGTMVENDRINTVRLFDNFISEMKRQVFQGGGGEQLH